MRSVRNLRGFTLVEMVIVMAILAITGGLIYRVAAALTTSYKTGETRIQVYENLRKGMASVVKDLRQARVASLMSSDSGMVDPPTGEKINFQVPQDLDGNGNVLDATTGIIEYSTFITLRMNTEGQLIREQDRDRNGMRDPNTPGEVMIVAINIDDAVFDIDFTDPENPTIDVTLKVSRKLEEGTIKAELTETVIPRN